MIRIGKLTDYAMLVLARMAQEPDSIRSASALAEALHLTPPTASKVLKILSDAGLVTSVRGADGGYRLARPSANITVADVISAMEGELAMTECCENISMCAIDSMCKLRENWRKINKMVHGLLDGITIDHMMGTLADDK